MRPDVYVRGCLIAQYFLTVGGLRGDVADALVDGRSQILLDD